MSTYDLLARVQRIGEPNTVLEDTELGEELETLREQQGSIEGSPYDLRVPGIEMLRLRQT
jgi:hypothetical protein